ncbi:hypothetical protein EVA_09490 [gut metagenome]|uniref:Uncharacterized protein n=1 Tax=gut metagenome TaxID=749906 RepID=J9CQH9_9ZZZZ
MFGPSQWLKAIQTTSVGFLLIIVSLHTYPFMSSFPHSMKRFLPMALSNSTLITFNGGIVRHRW